MEESKDEVLRAIDVVCLHCAHVEPDCSSCPTRELADRLNGVREVRSESVESELYTYRLHRCVYIDVKIEADSEDDADRKYNEMVANGDLAERWRDEILETNEEVAEVWEGGIDDGTRIYSIY